MQNWKNRIDGFTSEYNDLIYWYVVQFYVVELHVLVSDIFESSVGCS